MKFKQASAVTSWDGTWTYRPAVIVTPESVDDLVAILTDKERFPSPVRPAGSMHSPARMNGDDGGTMVDMRAMRAIIEITDSYARVEAGASYIEVTHALAKRGLQFHITTEIGNSTMAAMTSAASKDSSFPGEFGQVSSYAIGFKLVAPDGKLREVTEQNDAEEMRFMRSSYGLAGLIYEVTIRVRPAVAQSVRHIELPLSQFETRFREWREQGYAIMYYLFPYVDRVVVELRKERPGVTPRARRIWQYRNRFWRKYGPALALWIKRTFHDPAAQRRMFDLHFALLRRGLVTFVRSERAHGWAQTINYLREPGPKKYLFSMFAFPEAGYFEVLKEYFAFCKAYARDTGYYCDMPHVGYWIAQDRNAMLSYSWDNTTLSIDPSSTGGKDWEKFLEAYNAFCSERGGSPLLNQTAFLKPDQVRKAFKDRWLKFAEWRRARDPQNRMLDSYFRELLGE